MNISYLQLNNNIKFGGMLTWNYKLLQLQEYKKEILKEEEKVLDEIKNNLTT